MPRRFGLLAGLIVGACAFGLVAAFLISSDDDETAAPAAAVSVARARVERVEGLAVRVPAGRRLALRARPGGRVVAKIGARTEFGSPQTLAIAFRKGAWLAVRSPALGNERVGWVHAAPLRLVSRPLRVEVDVSRRMLVVVDHGAVSRRARVAVGAPATPTPTGEFYVTDKLLGADFGPYYGCCILALSGRQPRLPRGWSGGDRLAIHGTPAPDAGQAVTNGCLHLPDAQLRFLMESLPLGTVVSIHA